MKVSVLTQVLNYAISRESYTADERKVLRDVLRDGVRKSVNSVVDAVDKLNDL